MLDETRRAVLALVEDRIKEADTEGEIRYGTERVITPRQEMAYRLCHQDHFGLCVTDAAEVMGITSRQIRYLLAEVKAIAPQLFPVLSPKIARIYHLFVQDNSTIREIADELAVGRRYVQMVLRTLYDDRTRTGVYFRTGSSRRLSYCDWMDPHIRNQF